MAALKNRIINLLGCGGTEGQDYQPTWPCGDTEEQVYQPTWPGWLLRAGLSTYLAVKALNSKIINLPGREGTEEQDY